MQPDTYLAGEKIEPMHVLDFKKDFKDYQKFDIGAMGEFDVAVLIEQYAGRPISKYMYPEWRGGYYYAAKSKSDDKQSTAPLGLLYLSRWSSAETASQFAGIYAHSLKQRYKRVNEIGSSAKEGKETSDDQPKHDSAPSSLSGRHAWDTDEGTVVIEQQVDTVFVTESLDAATTSTLEREVFAAPTPTK